MKKLYLWLIVIAICLSFVFSFSMAGCKKETAEETTAAEEVTEETAIETIAAKETQVEETTVEEQALVTIKVWDWQVMENYMAAYDEMFKLYMEQNPNVTIERKAVASGEFEKQLKAALSGNEAPDLFQVQHGPQVTAYFESGSLYDFTADYNSDSEWQAAIDMNNPAYGDCFLDGKLVVLPVFDQWIHAIYYYKDMLDTNSITKPETVDDYVAIAKKLKSANIIPMMTAFGPNSITWIPNCMWAELMMQSYGGNVITDLETGKLSWNDVGVVDALKGIKKMFDAGVFPKDVNSAEYFPDVLTRFQNKEAFSFYIAGDWTIGSMNKEDVANDNIGVMSIPSLKAGNDKGYAAAAGVLYGMLPDNPNKEVVIDLIKFFSSKEAAAILVKNDIHPTSKLATELEIENNLMKAVIQESTNTDYFYSPYCLASNPDISTRVVENLGKLFNRLMTEEEACADLDTFTQEVLSK